MGTVYRARDPVMDRIVAIKVISQLMAGRPEQRARFFQEARTAGNLRHPNILIIYDCGEHDNLPYIVMEFLEGRDLKEIIAERENLSLGRRLNIVRQICEGLAHAHRNQIVHRDMKPANVRVLPDDAVKIMDFGVARIADSTQTQTGTLLGTVSYMSPEQCHSSQVTAATDIWSVGVILYEMLTFQRPFVGDNPVSIIHQIVSQPVAPLSEFLDQHPPELDAILGRALAKDLEQRYRDIEEMALDLKRLQEECSRDAFKDTLVLKQEASPAPVAPSPEEEPAAEPSSPPSAPEAPSASSSVSSPPSDPGRKVMVLKAAELIERGEFDEAEKILGRISEVGGDRTLIERLRQAIADERSRKEEPAEAAPLPPPAPPAQPPAPPLEPSPSEPFPSQPSRVASVVPPAPPVPESPPEPALESIEEPAAGPAPAVPEQKPTQVSPAASPVVEPVPPAARPRGRLVAAAAVAALLVVGGMLYWWFAGSSGPVPAPAVTGVSLNVLPWAEIVSVKNLASGEAVSSLKGGFTPIRLSLPEGRYEFTVRNQSLSQNMTFEIDVSNGQPVQVVERFPGFDSSQVLREFEVK